MCISFICILFGCFHRIGYAGHFVCGCNCGRWGSQVQREFRNASLTMWHLVIRSTKRCSQSELSLRLTISGNEWERISRKSVKLQIQHSLELERITIIRQWRSVFNHLPTSTANQNGIFCQRNIFVLFPFLFCVSPVSQPAKQSARASQSQSATTFNWFISFNMFPFVIHTMN